VPTKSYTTAEEPRDALCHAVEILSTAAKLYEKITFEKDLQ